MENTLARKEKTTRMSLENDINEIQMIAEAKDPFDSANPEDVKKRKADAIKKRKEEADKIGLKEVDTVASELYDQVWEKQNELRGTLARLRRENNIDDDCTCPDFETIEDVLGEYPEYCSMPSGDGDFLVYNCLRCGGSLDITS